MSYHKNRLIYEIVNKENHKKYIGVTMDYATRMETHFSELRNKKHGNKLLQEDFDKYGESSFYCRIIDEAKGLPGALRKEKMLMRSQKEVVYNLAGLKERKPIFPLTSSITDKSVNDAIEETLIANGITRSEWVRVAVLEKLEREGLI